MVPKLSLMERAGRFLARFILREVRCYQPFAIVDLETLRQTLQPGDIILVDGNQWISVAIKYLTQSTWSHAAFYVGDALATAADADDPPCLIEADLEKGSHAVPLSKYRHFNLRICRPATITQQDRDQAVQFMIGSLGLQYDLRNLIDLARYLLPTPPVPVRWRRRMLSLGSGSPTEAICSSLIAKAFQSVRYPILPYVETVETPVLGASGYSRYELYHIRHSSLFVPRDFDLSPYFLIIKPIPVHVLDYKTMNWVQEGTAPPAPLC